MATTLLCLALAVFVEARGEPDFGQEAVAHVVLNRAEIRNKEVCAVLVEKGQFPWHPRHYIAETKGKDGSVDYSVRVLRLPIRQKGWGKAMAVAQKVLQRTTKLQNVEFFHANYVSHPWFSKLKRVMVVGNHIFYARKQEVFT